MTHVSVLFINTNMMIPISWYRYRWLKATWSSFDIFQMIWVLYQFSLFVVVNEINANGNQNSYFRLRQINEICNIYHHRRNRNSAILQPTNYSILDALTLSERLSAVLLVLNWWIRLNQVFPLCTALCYKYTPCTFRHPVCKIPIIDSVWNDSIIFSL